MALPHIFDQGWPSPAKLSDDSKSAAILLNEAKETFAGHLGVRSDEINFLGEPNLGYHLGISGLYKPGQTFKNAATDRMASHVVAQALASSQELAVDELGQVDFSQVGPNDLLSIQLANRETGVIQKSIPNTCVNLFVDATTSGTRLKLPENWSAALWDSQSWMGPTGLGLFAIAKKALWKNPLPHLDNKVSPGPVSLPLIITSAIAIDSWVADQKNLADKISEISQRIRNFVQTQIPDSFVIAGQSAYLISIVFADIDSERMINELAKRGFAVDAGSACSAANMKPSHVLAAMGLATTGNMRLTIHHATTFEEVERFLPILKQVVTELRN